MDKTMDIEVTDDVLRELKEEMAEAKRKAEYQKLQQELKRLKESNEFEGAMQMPDTEQVLRTPRKRHHIIDILLGRLGRMFSIRPIIGNLIGIGLAFFALYYIYHEINMAGFTSYQGYFGIGIQLFAALQIIKSGTRSLILPVTAVVFGTIAAHTIPHHHLLFGYNAQFFNHLAIVGIIGMAASILSID